MAVTDQPQRFFFVHVMKTGGTSFVFHLLRNFAPSSVYPNEALDRRDPSDVEPYASIADLLRLTPERRAEIRVFAGHFPYVVCDQMGLDLVKLTLLREPVDRTISVLKHFKRMFERYRDLTLDEIYDDELVFRHFVEDHQTKVFALTADDRPQAFASGLSFQEIYAHLRGDPADEARSANRVAGATITIDADRLAQAKANLAEVDVLGLSEHYREFVEELRSRFGWWSAGLDDDARANVSSEPWEASVSLRARVGRENRFDLELYEYARELVRGRRS
jgi:hypothetical protein